MQGAFEKKHRWPDFSTTKVLAGYVGDQFARNRKTLVITHFTAGNGQWRQTMWEVGPGELRFIRQTTWSRLHPPHADWRWV